MDKLGQAGIDVYETDPLAESDQYLNNDKVDMKAKETVIDSSKDPFEQLAEYETAGVEEGETIDQKLQKLRLEIVKFQEEISVAKEKAKSEVQIQANMPETGEMLRKLDNLKGVLGSASPKVNITDPQGTVHKKLISDIDKFKARKVDEINEETKIEYQLFYPNKDSKQDRMLKVGELEKRLAHLEHIMGKAPEIPTPLMTETANKSLLEIVSNLVEKSKVLETQNWNDVETKAGSVLKRMDQIAEKKDIMEQKAKMDKISELYHIMLKWQKLSSMLPLVADRLTTLKTLHEQALEFKQLLGHLEVTQQQIAVQLKGHSELMKSVQGELSKNLVVIKTNCESIENKLRNANKI